MRKPLQLWILIAVNMLCLPALAEPLRQLGWEDLVPTHLRSVDPMADLTQEQQDLAMWAINVFDNLPERGPDTEELFAEVDNAIAELKQKGIDIDAIRAEREKVQTAMVEELNGQRVRIPGYLLPLEIIGSHVSEFLLVPYVGACIHVPPPPPNQIVHVNVASKKGYRSESLYEPVWITGVISVKALVKDLHLVDGSAAINVGYSMQATRIKPYRE